MGISFRETGRFDRVVITGEGDARSAVIYDFKTNARRRGEDDAEFARRMREQYAGQMDSYRRALERLTGIPACRIETKLLLVSAGSCLTV